MLAREPSDAQGFFNADMWLRALRQSRDLDSEPPFPPPGGVPHTASLVSSHPSLCVCLCISYHALPCKNTWDLQLNLPLLFHGHGKEQRTVRTENMFP